MKRAAFIFPGQGSQYVRMGKDLCENFSGARNIFEEANDTLHFSIKKVCFDGPEGVLRLTENTQPAILTTSVAALKVLHTEKGMVPEFAAGHSLGEYSALVASEALTFADAVRIVRLRGRFMQEAVPVGEGGMAAILGMGPEELKKLCEEVSDGEILSPANYNCPGQIVIAGHSKAIERAMEKAKQNGKRAILLPVSAPFHSPLMKVAGTRLKEALEGISIRDLRVPVVSNVEAEVNTLKDRVKDLLVAQVSSPVRWEESMQRLVEKGIEQVVEIGPGKVLCGLMKRIDPGVETVNIEDLKTLQKMG